MEENETFLKYLIDEEIYIVEDQATVTTGIHQDSVTDNPHGKEKEQIRDTREKTAESKRSVDSEEDGSIKDSMAEDNTTDEGSPGDKEQYINFKNTTILLLDYDDQTAIPPEHTDLLVKILQSVNLDEKSVEMVFREAFDQLDRKSFINCSVIAFLSNIPKPISTLFATEKYLINTLNENQFVACDTLNDLNLDRSLKRKLWEQLKIIYGM